MALSGSLLGKSSWEVEYARLPSTSSAKRPAKQSIRLPAVRSEAAPSSPATDLFDSKSFRRDLHKSDLYNRKGFGHKKEMLEMMQQEYTSDIVKTLKENNYEYTWGNVTVKLAESYGFCWGVERAVQIAYEARKQFPEEKIWVTNEIIHNPTVNDRLKEMKVELIPVEEKGKNFDVVDTGDVVILPAFGASVQEMRTITDKQVQIVDTTCPWVSKVWNTVETHKKTTFTSVIHGKYAHEETIATSSFAGKYIIVKNIKQATYVCDYMLGGKLDGSSGSKEEFLEKFKYSLSPGFDPDLDLEKVGIANQTTMLKGETEDIGKLFEKTMMTKFGIQDINDHFMSFNTICDATQVLLTLSYLRGSICEAGFGPEFLSDILMTFKCSVHEAMWTGAPQTAYKALAHQTK